MNTETKQCTKCKTTLPLDTFPPDKKKKDGLACWCRPCKNKAHERWRRSKGIKPREEHLDSVRKIGHCCKCKQYLPLWKFSKSKSRPNGIQSVCKACYRKLNIRKWWQETKADPEKHAAHKARTNKNMREYRKRPEYQLKSAARNMVLAAIKMGTIEKGPCNACGATEEVQAHHADYARPLEVEWLCRPCHQKHHHPHSHG